MGKIKIPQNLPDSQLIKILAEKANQRSDTDFNFLGSLDAFRQRVSGEVRHINQLFPEYTPHDEDYHLKRLFYVADRVLGQARLETMNSAELFILACALYGHDWGMAVSENEKIYVITGQLPEGTKADELGVLPNEQDRFRTFLRKQGLIEYVQSGAAEIDIVHWREYVRQTHAFRSGQRVRRFFEHLNGAVAEAVDRVCVGHALDFEELERGDLYPANFSALDQTVNLRALTVYLRLIDLLDLSEDRTPYVIWKFVAPRDPRSKMEWAKHRSVHSIAFPNYQEGRIIQVDGSTDDHEVYAALEDLRIWCQAQFKGCNDILARMNDPGHKLDLYHIDWRVGARGFEPISVQFEFDRDRMFEILGDEIYQGDPYVFLRELLQNSIDAIRMRRELLQRKGLSPEGLGVIRVTVEHGQNGDATVTWSDDGIGMDEYIIRNYMAVAGKSYYRSDDFEREGLEMDPISRFGIGTLSCFMVAERIEIETFRDPYLHHKGDPLIIIIPAMRQQFRIEKLSAENATVGTTFRVFVEGNKLSNDEASPVEPIDVTKYLSIIAGFVEFPIVITEDEHQTIILHPNQDAEAARRRFGETSEVQQLDLTYPWAEAFLPQDLADARESLREVRFDLSADFGLEGYEGTLAYPISLDDRADLQVKLGESFGTFTVVVPGQSGDPIWHIRSSHNWRNPDPFFSNEPRVQIGLSSSSMHSVTYRVYRDGILVPMASAPQLHETRPSIIYASLPQPQLVVNLSKSKLPRVDVARTKILGELEAWDKAVLKRHCWFLYKTFLSNLLKVDPPERLYQLGRTCVFHKISEEDLWDIFPHDYWPLPFLDVGGRYTVNEWKDLSANPICLVPDVLGEELEDLSFTYWFSKAQYEGALLHWAGEPCLIATRQGYFSYVLSAISGLCRQSLRSSHRFGGIRFLQPPGGSSPPLLQEVWLPVAQSEELPDIQHVLKKLYENPSEIDLADRSVLEVKKGDKVPNFIEFPEPFEQFFAYGLSYLNLRHPVTQALLRCFAFVELSKRNGLVTDQIGRLEDVFDSLNSGFTSNSLTISWEKVSNILRKLWLLAREARLLDHGELKEPILSPSEFVPGTLDIHPPDWIGSKYPRSIKADEPFGRPLSV